MDDNKDTLSGAIMNIKCQPTYEAHIPRVAYREGHRDARHAAAELVSEFAAQAEQSQSAGSARQGGTTSDEISAIERLCDRIEQANDGPILVSTEAASAIRRLIHAAAIASQSQAAQPTIKTWQERRQNGGNFERAMLDEIADLRRVLGNIVANAEIQPDARMGGKTDCYAVPLDDVDAARKAIPEPRAQAVQIEGEPDESFYRRIVFNNGWNACHAAHIAGTSQATKIGCEGTGKFGDMPCLGCDACPESSQATKAKAEPIYEEDLLDIVRTFCNIAQRMTELTPAQRENYPSPLSPSSPILIVAQNACIERGYTEWGLAIEGVEYPVASVAKESEKEQQAKLELTVWEGAMPESNGKSNFTAILTRKDAKGLDAFDGFTIARSEYPDRVRYEADCVRHLIGELAEKPWILDYDAEKRSGYIAPTTQQAAKAESEQAEGEQAHVMPPFAAPASQRDAGWLDVSKVVGVLRKNRKPKQGSAHESVVVTFGPMGINAADKFLREFSEMVWRDRTSSLSQKCDQSLLAGSAKGGNTNTNDSNSAATPTTSTVSAPVLFAAKRVDGGGYGSWLHTSRDQAERHTKNNGPAAPKYEVVGLVEVGAQAAPEDSQTDAARDVLAERRRQVEQEGWTPEHDDSHEGGEMAQAAACYAIKSTGLSAPAKFWPWSVHWFKGSDPRRCLVKAGALILADIERIDRAILRTTSTDQANAAATKQDKE